MRPRKHKRLFGESPQAEHTNVRAPRKRPWRLKKRFIMPVAIFIPFLMGSGGALIASESNVVSDLIAAVGIQIQPEDQEDSNASSSPEELLGRALTEWFDPAFEVLNGNRSLETCAQLINLHNQNNGFNGWQDASVGLLLEADLELAELSLISALTACALNDIAEIDAELAMFDPIISRNGPPSSW